MSYAQLCWGKCLSSGIWRLADW